MIDVEKRGKRKKKIRGGKNKANKKCGDVRAKGKRRKSHNKYNKWLGTCLKRRKEDGIKMRKQQTKNKNKKQQKKGRKQQDVKANLE